MQLNYKNISGLPLFLGLSEKEIKDIARNTRFNLRHHKKGSVIVEEGEACSSLISVVDGWVTIENYADDHSYHIEERAQATLMLEPDKLFGISPHYKSTWRAYSTCESICISKEELMQLFERYIIIRLNYLNLVCRRAQLIEQLPWQRRIKDVTEQIITFIKNRSAFPVGHKTFHIKMTQLAEELNISRTEVSSALNALNSADKIILHRGIIEIPALQLL